MASPRPHMAAPHTAVQGAEHTLPPPLVPLRVRAQASADSGHMQVLPVPDDSWQLPEAGNDTAYWHGWEGLP